MEASEVGISAYSVVQHPPPVTPAESTAITQNNRVIALRDRWVCHIPYRKRILAHGSVLYNSAVVTFCYSNQSFRDQGLGCQVPASPLVCTRPATHGPAPWAPLTAARREPSPSLPTPPVTATFVVTDPLPAAHSSFTPAVAAPLPCPAGPPLGSRASIPRHYTQQLLNCPA